MPCESRFAFAIFLLRQDRQAESAVVRLPVRDKILVRIIDKDVVIWKIFRRIGRDNGKAR